MSNVAEAESPALTPEDVRKEEQLPSTKVVGEALIDRWLAEGQEVALEKINARNNILDTLRKAAIKSTNPSDWIIHTARDSAGNIVSQRGYLQDSGAERAGKVWGVQISSPAIEREDFSDGSYTYNMLAEAWSGVTGERLEYVEGSRWSGDKFFTKGLQEGERPDPTDVRKSAYANLHGRAVRQLCGLNGVDLAVLSEAGINPDRVVHINYDKGGRGGESTGAAVGGSDIKMAWGSAKDKTPAEMDQKQLEYYLKKSKESLADDSKKRFHAREQRIHDALVAEIEKRKAGAQETAERKTGKAELQNAAYKKLTAAVKKNGGSVDALLDLICSKSSLQDCSEEDLQSIVDLSDEDVAEKCQYIGGGDSKE